MILCKDFRLDKPRNGKKNFLHRLKNRQDFYILDLVFIRKTKGSQKESKRTAFISKEI